MYRIPRAATTTLMPAPMIAKAVNMARAVKMAKVKKAMVKAAANGEAAIK